MLDRIDTWLLLAVLFGLLVCCLAASFARNQLLKRENDGLNFELVRQNSLANAYESERNIALARAESHCSYWILRRDERIESLEAENRAVRESMQEV